ncbi:MAG: hypothetical protein KDA91_01090 [Planctomycetaceae bacterium]|nr:hypothetical protein [Planctomycetaceae bacterium]
MRFAVVFVAGVVRCCTLFVALALTAWLNNGWSAAFGNLERVLRIHRELSFSGIHL